MIQKVFDQNERGKRQNQDHEPKFNAFFELRFGVSKQWEIQNVEIGFEPKVDNLHVQNQAE